jgi:phosphate transport system permease protein
MNRMARRNIVNALMLTITGICTVVTVSVLFLILGYLVVNGWRSLDFNFFTKLPLSPGETGGGVANAIVGSGVLILIASVIGIPVGFLGAIYLAEFGGKTLPMLIRYTADLLNGVPSIVIGIFAWTVIVVPMHHFSAWAGGFALSLMMIPIGLRATEQFLRGVPVSLREASLALGASKTRTIISVIVPAAKQGILTGMILGVARVAGETAPLLFTALNNQYWPTSWASRPRRCP